MTPREFATEAQIFFHNVQVGVADTGAADLNQHLAGAGSGFGTSAM
jgi:hypothetical protein